MTKETSIMAINDMPLLILVVHECDNVENESINIHAKIKESENDKEVELKNERREEMNTNWLLERKHFHPPFSPSSEGVLKVYARSALFSSRQALIFGRSTSKFRPHSSLPQHYRILHSNLARKTM
jgi:hypothetical protein